MNIALKHFDEFYGNVYGQSWKYIRAALLIERHKYMAVVNIFSDVDRIKSELEVFMHDREWLFILIVCFFVNTSNINESENQRATTI